MSRPITYGDLAAMNAFCCVLAAGVAALCAWYGFWWIGGFNLLAFAINLGSAIFNYRRMWS